MKFKRLLSGALAAAMAISSISLSAFGALAADSQDYLKITEFTGDTTLDKGVDTSGPAAMYGKGGFSMYIYDPDMNASIISDDDLNSINNLPSDLKKISVEVEVSGTIDSPFNLTMEVYDSDFIWCAYVTNNKIYSDKATITAANITEAGTYTIEIVLADSAIFKGLYCMDLRAVENGSATKNPNAEIKLNSITFGEAPEEPSDDINGTLGVAVENASTYVDEPTSTVINAAGDYTLKIDLSTATSRLGELGYFTFSPMPEEGCPFTLDVNSIKATAADGSEKTFIPLINNKDRIPTESYVYDDNEGIKGSDSARLANWSMYDIGNTKVAAVDGDTNSDSYIYLKSGDYIAIYFDGAEKKISSIEYNVTVKTTGEDPTEPIDYTALDEAIAAGEAVNTIFYTEDSVKVLTDAITAAQAVKENTDATQADVDAAAKAITDAIAGLAERTNKNNVEIVLTDEAKCYNEGNAFKYALDGSWAAHHIVSADSLAYLKSGKAAMDKITAAVTVSGTVSQEFTLNLCYAGGNYAYWGEGDSSNKGMIADVLNVTKPGVYYISMAFDTTANPTGLNYIGIQGSSNSYKNNPDAAVTVEEIYINDETVFTGSAYKSLGYSLIKGYSGPFKTVAIPETYEGLPVQSINTGALEGNTDIKSVYVPDSVTTIGSYAFRNCTNLESVRLPESLATVSMSLFQGCTSLKTVEIPESVTEIAGYAFMGSGITSIVIPDSVTTLGSSIFKDAVNLTDVTLPSGITTIPSSTFSNSGLVTYTVPDSVTSIAQNAFEGCAKLESVTIPNADIEAWAFKDCTSLTSVTLPEGKKIGIQAFMGCTNLTSVVIPENADIWTDTFTDTGLKEVTLPLSVSLGSRSFGYTSDGAKVDGFIIRMNLESITETTDPKTALTSNCEGYNYAVNNGFILADEYQNKLLKQDIAEAETITNDDNKYTSASFDSLQKAIAAAKTLTDDSDRGAVIESRNQIADAIAALTEAPTDPSADVYTWTGTWTRATGLVDAGTANGITVENMGGGWQMLIKDLDISGMVKPVLVGECTANKIQVWKGQSTSSSNRITAGAESGEIVDLTNYRDATMLTLSLTNTGSITSVKIYDAAYVAPLDYAKLDEAISNGQAIDTSKYTAETAAELTAAITAAQTVKNNTDATQEDIDAAAAAITSAIDKLVEKTVLTAYLNDYSKNSEKILKSAAVEVNGKGDYSVTLSGLNESYVYYHIGGFTYNGTEDYVIDVNSVTVNNSYELTVTSGNMNIVPGEMVKANGMLYGFASGDVLAQNADGSAMLKAYSTTSFRLMINNSPVNVKSITYNVTVKSKDDIVQADKTALEAAISDGKAVDLSTYTADTYKAVTDAVAAAEKVFANATATQADVDNAAKAITDAIAGLIESPKVDPASEPFEKIYTNKVQSSTVLLSGTVGDDIAGATRVRITFDCSSDASYNPNASVEFKMVAGGAETGYKKYTGTDGSYKVGTTGWMETLELSKALEAGQSYELSGFTYSWDQLTDYVYGVTRIEFIDANGKVIKTVVGSPIDYTALDAAIEDGEAVDTTKYTDDSVKVLTDAIAAGKAVKENADATQTDVDAAAKAITNAIAGLELKVVTGNVTGTIKVSDKDDSTEMTVKAVAADGTETVVTATSMGTYVLENLAVGEYSLTISGGKYATRTYEITVEAGDIAQDVELNPLGDINGDGKVTTADVGMANSHAKGVNTLEGYKFVCADVRTDGSITTADVGMINSHAKDVKTLW